MTEKYCDYCDINDDKCQFSYFLVDIFFNLILLILLICKTVSDSKDIDNKNTLLKLDSAMIIFSIAIIVILSNNIFLYFKNLQNPGIIKKKNVEIKIAIINKFRGFKVNRYEYTNLNSYDFLTSEDIDNLLHIHLNYTITNSQVDLIRLINDLRKEKNVKELKYYMIFLFILKDFML